jgi:hypothetical protein
MDAVSSNISATVWGFIFVAIKYGISNEAISVFVDVVTAVFIKFTCFRISSNFRSKNLVAYSQEMHASLLNASADFLHLNYRLRDLHHMQHTVGILLRSRVDK